MRTGQSLFNDIAVMEAPATIAVRREGRNSQLISNRNTCLADRLYYYRNFSPYREDVIKEKLEEEFFITRTRILEILYEDAHTKYLRELMNTKPTKTYFINKWPHLRW